MRCWTQMLLNCQHIARLGFKGLLASYLLAALFFLPSFVSAAVHVEGMRIWTSTQKTRFVLDVNERPTYQVFTLDNPLRVVLDVSQASIRGSESTDLKNSVIKNIRTGRQENGVLRLVLDVAEPIIVSDFTLAPNHQYGHRLVLDLKHTHVTKKSAPQSFAKRLEQVKSVETLRELVVVIDPGHGGEDPGAIGPKGTLEKDVVLRVAKALYKQLDQEVGIRPVLTRTGDYYVGLKERRKLARDRHQADLFISIHADAWTKPSVRGASVYVVSPKGASSTLAQFLADSANKSDRIGGVQITQENHMIRDVLADLALAGNLEHSFRVGNTVLDSLGDVAHLHKRHIEQAGFMVLKSLDVPSILVETGFISNPSEERRLRTSTYQRKVARALAKGVTNYFRQYPPPKTLFAAWYGKPTIEHTIVFGETLSGIAVRYGVSLSAIRKLNQMQTDRIRVGQVLRVPNTHGPNS